MENKKIPNIYKCNMISVIPSKDLLPCIELDLGAFGGITLDIQEAKFIKQSLEEIIAYYEKNSKETREKWLHKHIKIVSGRFSGLTGTITDVDVCDKERPLIVKLNRNLEADGCVFIDWADIEINENP